MIGFLHCFHKSYNFAHSSMNPDLSEVGQAERRLETEDPEENNFVAFSPRLSPMNRN